MKGNERHSDFTELNMIVDLVTGIVSCSCGAECPSHGTWTEFRDRIDVFMGIHKPLLCNVITFDWKSKTVTCSLCDETQTGRPDQLLAFATWHHSHCSVAAATEPTRLEAWSRAIVAAEMNTLGSLPEENPNKPGSEMFASMLRIASVAKAIKARSSDYLPGIFIALSRNQSTKSLPGREVERQWNNAWMKADPRPLPFTN